VINSVLDLAGSGLRLSCKVGATKLRAPGRWRAPYARLSRFNFALSRFHVDVAIYEGMLSLFSDMIACGDMDHVGKVTPEQGCQVDNEATRPARALGKVITRYC
jgi:hypothetical protein